MSLSCLGRVCMYYCTMRQKCVRSSCRDCMYLENITIVIFFAFN